MVTASPPPTGATLVTADGGAMAGHRSTADHLTTEHDNNRAGQQRAQKHRRSLDD